MSVAREGAFNKNANAAKIMQDKHRSCLSIGGAPSRERVSLIQFDEGSEGDTRHDYALPLWIIFAWK